MLTFVIDPTHLVTRDYLMDEIRAITRYVTASPARKRGAPVLIPGDPERATRAERVRDGIGRRFGLVPADPRVTQATHYRALVHAYP